MIERWLESRLGTIISAGNGKEVKVDCPFCQARVGREDTKQHLYVSTVKPVAHCFRCDWGGHYVGLIMSVDGCSYGQALKYLHERPPDIGRFDNLHSPRGLVQGERIASLPDGFHPLTPPLSKDSLIEQRAVYKYLRKRDVPEDLITSRFGYVPGSNRAWAIVDDSWWQGRLIIPGEPKYLSPPWPKGDSLWNAKALLYGGTIHIAEGIFSAIALGDSAVALCGKKATDEQLERLAVASVSCYVLALDADARSNAHELADQLRYAGFAGDLKIQYMLDGDPADGLFGSQVQWSWEEKVRAGIAS